MVRFLNHIGMRFQLRSMILLVASTVLLVSLVALPAFAVLPALPPPCAITIMDNLSVDSLAANVQAVSNDAYASGPPIAREKHCRARAMRQSPALISLMDSKNTAVQFLALSAVCGEGHRGDSAVPYILDRMRRFDPDFEQ